MGTDDDLRRSLRAAVHIALGPVTELFSYSSKAFWLVSCRKKEIKWSSSVKLILAGN